MNSYLQVKVKEWQKENGMKIEELKTKLDCQTRWNSLITMINSFLRIQNCIMDLMGERAEFSGYSVSEQDFEQIKSLQNGLKSLEELIK